MIFVFGKVSFARPAQEALLNPDSCPQAPETNRTKTNPDQADLFIASSFTPPITTF
jgi:hypothetical protein